MHQINVYQFNNDATGWKHWVNRYWFELPVALTQDNARDILKPLFEWHVFTLKTCCEVSFMTWRQVGGADNSQSPRASGICSFHQRDRKGFKPVNDEMRFKDCLRWRLEATGVNHGQTLWHGCLDKSQIGKPEHGRAFVIDPAPYFEIRENMLFAFENSALSDQFRVTGPFGVFQNYTAKRVRNVSGPFYTASHAVTRWRSRLKGLGYSIWLALKQEVQYLDKQHFEGGRFLNAVELFKPSQIWHETVAALYGVKSISEQIKDYLTDADNRSENGEMPPEVRFGPTGAYIREVWEKEAAKIVQNVPELQKIHRPFTLAGDEYIMRHDYQPYWDMLGPLLQKLSYTLEFDWWNYKAYPSQIPPSDYQFKTDALELLL